MESGWNLKTIMNSKNVAKPEIHSGMIHRPAFRIMGEIAPAANVKYLHKDLKEYFYIIW